MKLPYRLSIFYIVVLLAVSLVGNLDPGRSASFLQKFTSNQVQTGSPVVSLPDTALSAAQPARPVSSVFAEPAPAVRDNTPSFVPSEDLLRFVVQVVNGESQELRGVFVDRVLALAVVQQPPGDYLYVSANLGTITEFQSAALHGATGLLAHNYLSGALFFNLKVDQEVGLIFGDGRVQRYRISEILSFQKLGDEQSSPYLNIETGEVFDTKELFSLMYTQADRVTFQTCIKKGSDWSWGRIFIVAEPVL